MDSDKVTAQVQSEIRLLNEMYSLTAKGELMIYCPLCKIHEKVQTAMECPIFRAHVKVNTKRCGCKDVV